MTNAPTEIEESVVEDIRSRRDLGRRKYGKSMERGDLSQRQWLQHAYEECLDLAIYLRRSIRDMAEKEDAATEPETFADPSLYPEC